MKRKNVKYLIYMIIFFAVLEIGYYIMKGFFFPFTPN